MPFSPRYLSFLLLALLAVVVASYRIHMKDTVITSPNDQRIYRAIELENGLQAILVSDPESDKAAASLAVNVGSGDDPADRQGLAHFLEHMLFLGTEPFPEAGEYQAFINQHGGSNNAFTAHDVTNYFFELDNDSLEGALDRFAPFFISPTFDAQYVERETNAVNAEYTSKSQDDGRRIYSAEKQAMNPDHPYAKFATGSLETLADRDTRKIRDDLIEFYNQHYSSDQMTMAVIANYPIDTLEEMVQQRFNAVPKKQVQAKPARPELYVTEQLPLELQIKPIKELRQLKLTFPMPESLSLYANKPQQMLGHLLGHEGEGSLLALFKQRGWAEGLSAGRSLNTEWESTFNVSISLTMVGMYRVDEITEAIFVYIDLLKDALQKPEFIAQVYSEQRNLAELAFRFQEKSRASHLAMRLANNLRHVSPQQVIYGDYRWETPSAETLTPYLDRLTPQNLVRTLIAPEVETTMRDTWYDTDMMLRPLQLSNNKLKAEYKAALSLPKANPFVPENFDLTSAAEQTIPAIIKQQPGLRLWYYPEQEFKLPKARVMLSLQNQAVADNAKSRLIAQLFSHSVNEEISAFTYPAYIAGLNYHLAASNKGLDLVLAGYHDKLPVLLDKIAATMQSIEPTDEQFERYKSQLKRQLENRLKSKPYERTISELRTWLREPAFDTDTLLNELENIQKSDIQTFKQQLLASMYIEAYVHGSLDPEQALAIVDVIDSAYKAKGDIVETSKIKQATKGKWQQAVNADHPDSAISLYVQGQQYADSFGIRSDQSRARYALLAQMISSPYYKWLRTDKKLGYVVSASAFPQKKVPGIVFIVQSPTATPEVIMHESQQFFASYSTELNALSNEGFEKHKQGLISKLTSKKKNMAEKAGYFWHEIDAERLTFDTNHAIAKQVDDITLTEIQTLFQNSIIKAEDPQILFNATGKGNLTTEETNNKETSEKESTAGSEAWQLLSNMKDTPLFE